MAEQHSWTAELETKIRDSALDAGFHLVGIASAMPASERRGIDRFEAWVNSGYAGEMEYLKRRDAEGTLLRSDLRVAIPWAKSIIVCALNYDSGHSHSIDPAATDTGWIGRYAWSGRRDEASPDQYQPTDYHDELLTRLREIETSLAESVACETRCYVDTGPIVEREFAAKAGVGWIGKNTCVINQNLGSWLLLGVVVTSLPLGEQVLQVVAADRCGSCTRCIDACPTDALVAPREMDASRCIAYLTIEKKGAIDPELRLAMGRQVFGCDICQDVCPWNQRRNKNARNSETGSDVTLGMEPRPELVNPPLEWLGDMDTREFKRQFEGSPLERTGRRRLHRNVAIAMGNSGVAGFLPRLQEWSESEDAVLADAAGWAIERLEASAGVGNGS